MTKTSEKYLNEIKEIHGNIYDYSLVDYVGSRSNIKIICSIHGVFNQRADVHLMGGGCKRCNRNKYLTKKHINKPKDFIKKSKKIHNNLYDYSKVKYIASSKKVIIICKTHGEFLQTPSSHMRGNGCEKCGRDIANIKKTFTTEEVLLKIKQIYGDKFTYNNFVYNGCFKKSTLTCKLHGDFKATGDLILRGTSCPTCKRSFGELQVAKWLDENNIEYIEQFSDDSLRFKGKLKFDFMLPKFKIIIEYDGLQHFKPVDFFNGEGGYKETVIKDIIKNEWAKVNGYKVLRISHINKKYIGKILKNYIYKSIIKSEKILKLIEEYEKSL